MELRNKLVDAGYPEKDVKRFLAYIDDAKRDAQKASNRFMADDKLYSMFVKYHNIGLVLDGVNVTLAGPNMAMITYHGFVNKILTTYPESEIDVQLVREGDDFKVAKESGSVIYTHTIANPFGDYKDHPIIGAYAVIKNKRGEKFESLNPRDYEEMKNSSKNKGTWDKWPSEFWLKSVIKRICKRYFYDIVADIDKVDNEDFGAEDFGSTTSKKDEIVNAVKKDTDTRRGSAKPGVVRTTRKKGNRKPSPRTPSQGKTSSPKPKK